MYDITFPNKQQGMSRAFSSTQDLVNKSDVNLKVSLQNQNANEPVTRELNTDNTNSATLQYLLNPKIKTGTVRGFDLISLYDRAKMNEKALLFLKSLIACEGGINRTLRSGTGDIDGGNLAVLVKDKLSSNDYYISSNNAYVNTVVTNPAGLSAFHNSRLISRGLKIDYKARTFKGFNVYIPAAVLYQHFQSQMPDYLESTNLINWKYIDEISYDLNVQDYLNTLQNIVTKVGVLENEDVMDFCAYYNQAWHNPAHALNNKKFLIRSTKYKGFFLYESRRNNFLGVFE